MLNKKGLATHWFMMIGYIMGILAFLTMLGFIVLTSIAKSADTYHMEHYILFNRLIYSTDSIFYHDDSIGRTYIGVVDMDKFDEETFNNLFGKNDNFGVKLSIGDQATKKDIFYNKNFYEIGEYSYKIEDSIYGGFRYNFPVINKDGKNDVLLMGLMHKK